jgi:hypothetical protein
MSQFANKESAENQAQAPREQRCEHREQRHHRDRSPRGFRNSSQRSDGTIDDRRRGNDISADDDHHHLHGERDQSPEVLPALDGQLGGALMKQKPDDEDDHDSQQRENQRIGEPSLAPARETEAETDESLLLNCRVFLIGHVHTRSFRYASGLCPTL